MSLIELWCSEVYQPVDQKLLVLVLVFLFLILHFCLCMFFLTTVSLSSAVFFHVHHFGYLHCVTFWRFERRFEGGVVVIAVKIVSMNAIDCSRSWCGMNELSGEWWHLTSVTADWCSLYMMCTEPEDLAGVAATDTASAAGDTASCASEQSVETRRRNKIIVRRTKSSSTPTKMRTCASMPKVSFTFISVIVTCVEHIRSVCWPTLTGLSKT